MLKPIERPVPIPGTKAASPAPISIIPCAYSPSLNLPQASEKLIIDPINGIAFNAVFDNPLNKSDPPVFSAFPKLLPIVLPTALSAALAPIPKRLSNIPPNIFIAPLAKSSATLPSKEPNVWNVLPTVT